MVAPFAPPVGSIYLLFFERDTFSPAPARHHCLSFPRWFFFFKDNWSFFEAVPMFSSDLALIFFFWFFLSSWTPSRREAFPSPSQFQAPFPNGCFQAALVLRGPVSFTAQDPIFFFLGTHSRFIVKSVFFPSVESFSPARCPFFFFFCGHARFLRSPVSVSPLVLATGRPPFSHISCSIFVSSILDFLFS